MIAFDHLTLDARKTTKEGFLAVRARAARTGLYDYAGFEVDPDNAHGLRDKAVVKVYRSGDQVFDRASIASFIGKPITNDHPATAVTADNWREHARGTVMGAVRDGEYVSFDLMLTDAAAIAAVKSGKRELSNGYQTTLDFTPGTTPEGHAYDVKQTAIVGNHIAIVDRGRAGPECRIADAIAVCDANPAAVAALSIALQDGAKEAVAWLKKAIALHEKHMNGSAPTTGKEGEKSQMLMMEQMKNALAELGGGDAKSGETGMKMDVYPSRIFEQENPMKTLTIDGLKVPNISDEAEAAIVKLQADKAAADKALAAKDSEIDELKAKVVDQATIDALADAKAEVVAKAKAVVGDKLGETKGKTVAEVRRMALDAAAIDVADKSDDYVEARFDALTADAKPATATIHNLPRVTATDAQSAEAKAFADSVANLNAWRKAKA